MRLQVRKHQLALQKHVRLIFRPEVWQQHSEVAHVVKLYFFLLVPDHVRAGVEVLALAQERGQDVVVVLELGNLLLANVFHLGVFLAQAWSHDLGREERQRSRINSVLPERQKDQTLT